jgi:UDP-glucose 4-epimerase
MKILITGSQGFIGRHLAHYALSKGHEVLGVDRLQLRKPIPDMEFSRCQVDTDEFIDLINRYKPDMVFHGAGSASVGYSFQQPRQDFLMAVGTWAAVLDAVRKSELNPLIIFPSSASVYGNPKTLPVPESTALQPISPYGFHKVISEQLAQEYCQCFNLNVVVARLFSTIGPGQQRLLVWELFQQAIEKDKYNLTIQGTGNETRDFLYIDDISYFILGILENQPKGFLAVNVASGQSTSVRAIAEMIIKLSCSKQSIITLNKELPGDPKKWQADISLLQSLVPFQPRQVEQGLDACLKYWLKYETL